MYGACIHTYTFQLLLCPTETWFVLTFYISAETFIVSISQRSLTFLPRSWRHVSSTSLHLFPVFLNMSFLLRRLIVTSHAGVNGCNSSEPQNKQHVYLDIKKQNVSSIWPALKQITECDKSSKEFENAGLSLQNNFNKLFQQNYFICCKGNFLSLAREAGFQKWTFH